MGKKNDYFRTVDILENLSSTISKHNRLVQIKNRTDDFDLSEHITATLKFLRSTPNSAQRKKFSFAPFPSRSPVYGLYEYCIEQTAKQKPEWQILAEKHEWKPPKDD